MKTAVEWLEEIYLTTGIDRNVHFKQAKQIEKEQIINAHIEGQPFHSTISHKAEEYYNQTYN